jgi:hypothetical protein
VLLVCPVESFFFVVGGAFNLFFPSVTVKTAVASLNKIPVVFWCTESKRMNVDHTEAAC